jgi:hypothetical protein
VLVDLDSSGVFDICRTLTVADGLAPLKTAQHNLLLLPLRLQPPDQRQMQPMTFGYMLDDLSAIKFVPAPIEVLGHCPELDDEVYGRS